MANSLANRLVGASPRRLRRQVRLDAGGNMQRRRATVGVALVGMASMAFTTMLQMGIVRRLPDPRVSLFGIPFRTKRVNLSQEAFSYGGPDSPVVVLTHALNLVLASTGRSDRARTTPWLPILAAGLAGAQSVMAAKYLFYQMPKVDRAYCPYCIVDALTHFATFGLTLPEAAEAIGHAAERRPTALRRR